MKITPTALPDVLILEPNVLRDSRGFFLESFNPVIRDMLGVSNFAQDNHSHSKKSVLRGLHYQVKNPQGKLVRVVSGIVYDVAVDLRKNSPTFGRYVGTELSAENQHMVWIPPGFAHGFLTLSDTADLLYKVTVLYDPKDERTIRWNDSSLGIAWPLFAAAPILSEKDASGASLTEAQLN